MSQQLPPGWAETDTEKAPPCFRINEAALPDKRSRGGRRGTASRYGLRNLPPINPEDPEDFGV